MNRKNIGLGAAFLAMLILIWDSRGAAQAASEGVAVCIRTVIPNLFPFFILSGYLTGGLESGKLMRCLSRTFHSAPSGGSIIAAGLMGGYPLGAKLAQEGYAQGRITRKEADSLLAFCSQAGPSFLFGMVAPQFPDARYSWMLWAVQFASTLSVAWLMPEVTENDSVGEMRCKVPKSDPMKNALYAIAAVCGWVIVCGVILRYLKIWVLRFLPQWAQVLFCGLLELTNGSLLLSTVESESLRFLLAAVMLNFGGLCVMLQTASVTKGLTFRNYIWGKFHQTLFSVGYAGLLTGKIGFLLPIILGFSGKLLKNPRNRYSISPGIGV
jgi:hypothetical protein